MKNIWLFLLFLSSVPSIGHGQIPQITILAPDDKVDSVSPHIFRGKFCIDSIYEMGDAYLINVISVDTVETSSPLMSPILGAGVPFTVISFKSGIKNNEHAIRKGDICYFTLSPPEGVWTLLGHHYDDWGYSQSVQDPMGNTVKVPLPLIKTQLMLSSELKGLQYIPQKR